MNKSKRQRLIELGPDALADMLLDLASDDDVAAHVVQRSIAPPSAALASGTTVTQEEGARAFKRKLANIQRRTRGYDWDEAAHFADELSALLRDLARSVDDAVQGLSLVASFFDADADILGLCDDSSGYVGDVFRRDATELFARYAAECADESWAEALLVELYLSDEYATREELVHCAGRCFGAAGARKLVKVFQDQAEQLDSPYSRFRHNHAIESLARQLGDAELFERTRLASWPRPPKAGACVDIAEVYLETGSEEAALSWLERIPPEEPFEAERRDALLLATYGSLGRQAQLEEVAWRVFRRRRRMDTMEELVEIIGDDRREDLIEGEVALILADNAFSTTDAHFLLDLGKMDEVERYILDRSEQLNGDDYYSLPPLAESLEKQRPLAASATYRALLDSVLGRGASKAYAHGVRYLRKLDKMAKQIADWGSLGGHEGYVERLREQHRRKRSFWERYNG